jgi:alkylation response protein AidB-like acyl-CoA dehydrogenase
MTLPTPSFAQAFARIRAAARAEAVNRERDHSLPFDTVEELQRIGFGSRRLTAEPPIPLTELFGNIIDLAAADSNIAHLFRGHIAFVETLLFNGDTATQARWTGRLRNGALVGNAQSERGDTTDIATTLTRTEDGARLNGCKYYTTGSIYADWIHVSAMDGGDYVGVTVDARDPGVVVADDWDGFGQQLTGSGSTTFTDVPVAPVDIETFCPDGARFQYITGIYQLCLLATVAGIAEAALADTVDFVRPRRRTFAQAGQNPPRESELVQASVGRLSAASHTARAAVLSNAAELDRALAARLRGEEAGELFLAAQLGVFKTQQTLLPLVLGAVTELFEVGGASAVGTRLGLDRHWRNARTIASHNPAAERARQLGDYHLNGRLPAWRSASGVSGPAPASIRTAIAATAEGA